MECQADFSYLGTQKSMMCFAMIAIKNFCWSCLLAITLMACQSSYTYTTQVANSSNGVSNELKADESITAMIAPFKAKLDKQMTEVIGEAAMDLTEDLVEGETTLGNFCSGLMYEQAKKYGGADCSLVTTGGLRVPIAKGEVDVRLIYELMPFDNEFVIITVEGEAMEQLIYRLQNDDDTALGNVKATFRRNKLVSATIGGEKFDKTKRYKIVTSDYLANGGNNMDCLENHLDMELTGVKLRDAIINHFRDLTKAGKKASATVGISVTYE